MKILTMTDHLWIILIGSLLMFPIFIVSTNIFVTMVFLVLAITFYRVVGWVEAGNRRFLWESRNSVDRVR